MSDRIDMRPVEYKPPSIEEVARREGTFLRRVLSRLGVQARDIDDVAQEVLLGLHKALTTFAPKESEDPKSALRGLVFTIAKARAARCVRRILQAFEVTDDDLELENLEGCPTVPDEQYSLAERRVLLVDLLACIPAERRAVVLMYDVEQTPMAEIAESLRIPENTGWNRRRLGLLDLRAEWTRRIARQRRKRIPDQ